LFLAEHPFTRRLSLIIDKLAQKILKEEQMYPVLKTTIILLLTALFIAGCSSDPEVKKDPYGDADSQRSRAKQTQDELSRDTSK
jgi:hypothetical protein